mgnify:CR=1 FL=1
MGKKAQNVTQEIEDNEDNEEVVNNNNIVEEEPVPRLACSLLKG